MRILLDFASNRRRKEAELETLTLEVLKSSEIEGENLDAAQVRSSVARRLGIEIAGMVAAERDVEGVVEMMVDATRNYAEPLSNERLFAWHAAMFPTGRGGMRKIVAGAWREDAHGPMQVVSGPAGKEKVHFEAPAASLLGKEMAAFFAWANDSADRTDTVLLVSARATRASLLPLCSPRARLRGLRGCGPRLGCAAGRAKWNA